MAKTYFKNVLKALDEDFSASEVQLNFIVLKGYEYWLRALRCEKRRPIFAYKHKFYYFCMIFG